MPSLPSPETTMTLAGVGMVRFVIPTLLSFSFSFSEESCFETKEEFCVCGFIRDGLKTNSPNQRTSFCLSLFLGRRRRAL